MNVSATLNGINSQERVMKQFTTQKESGQNMTSEQLKLPISQEQIVGVSDSLAKTSVSQEKEVDSKEIVQVYFSQLQGLLETSKKKDRPKYLFIENVKNLLSVNGGFDFLKLQIELDEIGYDCEWDVLNSKNFGVPQNRERVFIVGYLRGRSGRKVFPIGRENCKTSLRQVGNLNYYNFDTMNRIYDSEGLAPTLQTLQGGNREPKIAQAVLTPDRVEKRQNGRRIKEPNESMFTITTQDRHGVLIKEATKKGYAEAELGDSINCSVLGSKTRRGRVGKGVAQTLDTQCNQATLVPYPTPGEGNAYAITTRTHANYNQAAIEKKKATLVFDNSDYRIRKLTPRECWRLQGFPDWAFDKAQEVNSNSQLYKQAGNSVTVNVIYQIAVRMEV